MLSYYSQNCGPQLKSEYHQQPRYSSEDAETFLYTVVLILLWFHWHRLWLSHGVGPGHANRMPVLQGHYVDLVQTLPNIYLEFCSLSLQPKLYVCLIGCRYVNAVQSELLSFLFMFTHHTELLQVRDFMFIFQHQEITVLSPWNLSSSPTNWQHLLNLRCWKVIVKHILAHKDFNQICIYQTKKAQYVSSNSDSQFWNVCYNMWMLKYFAQQ